MYILGSPLQQAAILVWYVSKYFIVDVVKYSTLFCFDKLNSNKANN